MRAKRVYRYLTANETLCYRYRGGKAPRMIVTRYGADGGQQISETQRTTLRNDETYQVNEDATIGLHLLGDDDAASMCFGFESSVDNAATVNVAVTGADRVAPWSINGKPYDTQLLATPVTENGSTPNTSPGQASTPSTPLIGPPGVFYQHEPGVYHCAQELAAGEGLDLQPGGITQSFVYSYRGPYRNRGTNDWVAIDAAGDTVAAPVVVRRFNMMVMGRAEGDAASPDGGAPLFRAPMAGTYALVINTDEKLDGSFTDYFRVVDAQQTAQTPAGSLDYDTFEEKLYEFGPAPFGDPNEGFVALGLGIFERIGGVLEYAGDAGKALYREAQDVVAGLVGVSLEALRNTNSYAFGQLLVDFAGVPGAIVGILDSLHALFGAAQAVAENLSPMTVAGLAVTGLLMVAEIFGLFPGIGPVAGKLLRVLCDQARMAMNVSADLVNQVMRRHDGLVVSTNAGNIPARDLELSVNGSRELGEQSMLQANGRRGGGGVRIADARLQRLADLDVYDPKLIQELDDLFRRNQFVAYRAEEFIELLSGLAQQTDNLHISDIDNIAWGALENNNLLGNVDIEGAMTELRQVAKVMNTDRLIGKARFAVASAERNIKLADGIWVDTILPMREVDTLYARRKGSGFRIFAREIKRGSLGIRKFVENQLPRAKAWRSADVNRRIELEVEDSSRWIGLLYRNRVTNDSCVRALADEDVTLFFGEYGKFTPDQLRRIADATEQHHRVNYPDLDRGQYRDIVKGSSLPEYLDAIGYSG